MGEIQSLVEKNKEEFPFLRDEQDAILKRQVEEQEAKILADPTYQASQEHKDWLYLRQYSLAMYSAALQFWIKGLIYKEQHPCNHDYLPKEIIPDSSTVEVTAPETTDI
jgi:hypothetical protein